jgi:purine-binding chemotaxis protein CheW
MIGSSESRASDAADSRQFLTFRLAGEEYGVGILTVKEIRGWSPVTAIPHAPAWLLGVINLRGMVVPIIDLRLKFDYERAEYNDTTVVIILNVAARVVGIVVDAVSDVITLASAQIKPAPDLGRTADTSHIIGFGTLGDRMRILMDVERLMDGAELGDMAGNHCRECK